MRVSARDGFRHAFKAAMRPLVLASAAAALLFAAPASAGGGDGPGGGSGHGGSGCGGCGHGGGHNVRVPNINVHGARVNVGVRVHSNVNVTTNVTTNVDARANASAGASAGAGAVVVGGGNYPFFNTAPASTAITGLSVVGLEEETEWEWYEEERTRTVEEWRLVRAVCVDDTGTPHPASRPSPDERVARSFTGEIFRCMAGTRMQVTIGWRRDGHDDWTDAPTIMCRPREALRHTPGGELECAPEEPRRNCNERSLLRLYGPGVKLVYMVREERYTERQRREVARARTELRTMTLMLDGGVGGYR